MTSTASSSPEQVRQLFNPRSIALIGATDKSRWSWSTFGNLRLHQFPGPVYLVNPRGIPVHDQDSYASIADLPPDVDLAFVMSMTDLETLPGPEPYKKPPPFADFHFP